MSEKRPSTKLSAKLSEFEFRVFQMLGALDGVRGSRVLVACSGGLDSVVMLHALSAMAKKLDLTLAVVHVHHGQTQTQTQSQNQTRDQARDFVKALCLKLSLECEIAEAPSALRLLSEEALRDFRHQEIARVQREKGFDFVALAHHGDDLFETRLFRLIRGTGAQGLQAMSVLDDSGGTQKLRPFLGESRSAIRAYAEQNDLQWIEDVSNSDSHFFRNWLRNEWLPQLEAKRSGGVQSFARSLETLVQELKPHLRDAGEQAISLGKIERGAFEGLEVVRKRSVIATLAKSLGVRDFSQGRVEEVIKRLHHLESTGQKNAQFVVGSIEWSIRASEIEAQIATGPKSETSSVN